MTSRRRPLIALATTTAAMLASLSLSGSHVLAAGPAPAAVQACWDFSTLQQTVPYRLGDIFVAPTATIEMKHYLLNGNLNTNTAGLGKALQTQIAGGPAPEFRLYLLNAHIVPNNPLNTVTFNFGHQLGLGGGQANLGVNGELVEVTTSLADLDGREMGDPAIGRVSVAVALNGQVGVSPEQGTVTLQAVTGQIEKITIGGIQLYIDNLCTQ
ncbi:MAG: hypothetical protein ABIT71_19785 [Vicinamibacteraceae bacterium]